MALHWLLIGQFIASHKKVPAELRAGGHRCRNGPGRGTLSMKLVSMSWHGIAGPAVGSVAGPFNDR